MHESGFCSFAQHSCVNSVKKSRFLKKIYFVFNCVMNVFVYPQRLEVLDCLELSLQVVVSHPDGPGNETQVLGLGGHLMSHLEGSGPALFHQYPRTEAWEH